MTGIKKDIRVKKAPPQKLDILLENNFNYFEVEFMQDNYNFDFAFEVEFMEIEIMDFDLNIEYDKIRHYKKENNSTLFDTIKKK
jgi:hypothetical protein